MSNTSPSAGVIHDLGYRHYDGPRHTDAAIARALFFNGLGGAYGIGRTGRAKWIPFVLLIMYILPAFITVGVLSFGLLNELPTKLYNYPSGSAILPSIFVATQAPTIFGRDLRHRSIVLYMARPLSARIYALTRWASMTGAVFLFLLAPLVLLFLGGLLANLNAAELTRQVAPALGVCFLISLGTSSIAGIISSWTLRPGLSIVFSLAVFMLGNGIVAMLQAILQVTGKASMAAEMLGIFSPYAAANGAIHAFEPTTAMILAPSSAAVHALYWVVCIIGPALGVWLIGNRITRGGNR
ncbi:ABC-type transport system involved in multi-copper enzyme maturation, permease component [Dermatophilus congolensis]|uniref:ABC-type transport system involved in multi-copper enzyme maturation, permease component n=1 Tax=Dermatophilus congolensis TaxID=1863 RepID=A0AA46BPC4_9MICO|nr:hypothetical protein [Dermatophilus congolensis]STD12920.1 ABC-type transport system involved in multi-copper enzyme maturation, permease component [Dermatophilus congolensis]